MRYRMLLLVTGAFACSPEPPDDQATGSVGHEEMQAARRDIDPVAVERIDSANAAFRRDDFANASRLYREAAAIDDELAPAWFGIYMAETARKNVEAADSALARVQKLQPGASLVHPDRGSSGPPIASPH